MLAAVAIMLASSPLSSAIEADRIPLNFPDSLLDSPRSERFPSREERVKLYMSNWYTPPCPNYDEGLAHFKVAASRSAWPTYRLEEGLDIANHSVYTMQTSIEPDTAFVLDRATVLDCALREGDVRFVDRVQYRSNMYMYCLDVVNSVLPLIDHLQWEGTDVPPIVLQFGDLKHSHFYKLVNLPHLKKFRVAASALELEQATSQDCYNGTRNSLTNVTALQPIVWKLATRRHYGLVNQVIAKDRPWEQKKNMAVFRGQLTGSRDGFDENLSDIENCMNLRRCRLVYRNANSTIINARLTDTRGRLPDVLNGVNLTTPSVSMRHLLRYKGIVMLEGNDVASGLKWALLSESVVLMPVPKHSSWAMEELLQPWVHFVPLNDDITDVEDKMQWILDHEENALKISAAATLWMQDLVFHPDAEEDDRWIQEEILRRYSKHFAPSTFTPSLFHWSTWLNMFGMS